MIADKVHIWYCSTSIFDVQKICNLVPVPVQFMVPLIASISDKDKKNSKNG
jgi:hypothetical protein